MDNPQQQVNAWGSSVDMPATLSTPTMIPFLQPATCQRNTNDLSVPPLPTYRFVEGPQPPRALTDMCEGDAYKLQQQHELHAMQRQRHRQYAVDQGLSLDGDIATLSESGSGSTFANMTITSNNATGGILPAGGFLHSPTALTTPFIGVQQPNFYVNNNNNINNHNTTPTSSAASAMALSFAPPITSPATPPGLQQQPSMFSSSSGGSPAAMSSAAAFQHGADDVDQLSSTNVFVSHLPAFVDDVALRSLFSRFGPILSSVVMRDIYSGVSRGIAFVEYENETSAAEAIVNLDKLAMEDKIISVQRGKRFSRGAPTSRVFVRNIPKAVSEAELYDVCSKYGDVSWLSLHADSMRHSVASGSNDAAAMMALESAGAGKQDRNIAFVTFASKEAASAAAVSLHNASPFAGADGVPLLTKVVLDNLPPRSQRKASALPPPAANSLQHPRPMLSLQQHQQQQQQQQQPPSHFGPMPGGALHTTAMLMPHQAPPYQQSGFQPAMHSPLTAFNVFHPPQHTAPHQLHGAHQQQQNFQPFTGSVMIMQDGTTVSAAPTISSPSGPMHLVPHLQQHQLPLPPAATTSTGTSLFMASPPSHQYVFATMPPHGQQQQQFHPLQSTGVHHHPFHYASLHSVHSSALLPPLHQQGSGNDGLWPSSSSMGAADAHQQQVHHGMLGNTGHSATAGGSSAPPADAAAGPPPHLMFWNASALM
jgi:RNA recognition motif-containing protein